MDAIFGFLTSLSNVFIADKEARYGRLPDWLTARDFQQGRDNTFLYIILALIAMFMVITVASIAAARK